MRKRVCLYQSMVLETRLNIHLSRCEHSDCKYYLNPVGEDICNACPQKMAIEGEDDLANSMKDDVFAVELDERLAEVIVQLFEKHCESCIHYSKQDSMCGKLRCDYAIPIKTLMRNPNIKCPLELW